MFFWLFKTWLMILVRKKWFWSLHNYSWTALCCCGLFLATLFLIIPHISDCRVYDQRCCFFGDYGISVLVTQVRDPGNIIWLPSLASWCLVFFSTNWGLPSAVYILDEFTVLFATMSTYIFLQFFMVKYYHVTSLIRIRFQYKTFPSPILEIIDQRKFFLRNCYFILHAYTILAVVSFYSFLRSVPPPHGCCKFYLPL